MVQRSVIAMFTKNLHTVAVHMRFVFRVTAIINTFLINEIFIRDVSAVTLLDFLMMFFSPKKDIRLHFQQCRLDP